MKDQKLDRIQLIGKHIEDYERKADFWLKFAGYAFGFTIIILIITIVSSIIK